MARIARIGRLFFAVAFVAFGVLNFVVGDFVAGRAPAWPVGVPGRLVWAYVSGAIMIASGAALAARWRPSLAGALPAAMIVVWALARGLPIMLADHEIGSAWTGVGKALALSGGALAVAAAAAGRDDDRAIAIGRTCLACFFSLCGIQHFLWPEVVARLVPTWIPGAMFWTYFAGAALVAAGLGLLVPWTRRLAAGLSGLMVFMWLLMLHIPRAVAAPDASRRNEWTAVFEALAVSGIAFVLAGQRERRERAEPRTK